MCVLPTCCETSLLLPVAEVTVGIILQPPLLFSLLGRDAGRGDAARSHRLHAPVLPFDHVGDTTLGHGCGLGHSFLHGAAHPWEEETESKGGRRT